MNNMHEDHVHHHEEETTGIKAYQPLIVIVATVFFSAVALRQTGFSFMHGFMGLFLVTFAMFKFFDLKGFADGFSTYDLLAARWRGYAFAYPFIELGLGLAYLSWWHPAFIYFLTVVVMGVSAFGVVRSIRSGQKIKCACLGTILKVPLSTVSVVENLGMGLMAAWMLVFG